MAGAGHRGTAGTELGQLALPGPAPPPLLAGPTWPWRRTQRDSPAAPGGPSAAGKESGQLKRGDEALLQGISWGHPTRRGSAPSVTGAVTCGSCVSKSLLGLSFSAQDQCPTGCPTSVPRHTGGVKTHVRRVTRPGCHLSARGPGCVCACAGTHSRDPRPGREARRARPGRGSSGLTAPSVSAGAPLGGGPRGWPLKVTLLLILS